ncbi:MAG: hypothetical protein GOV01_00080 [Candidatus Altiarchaeota archaeon]|nr:hypothetical protein [Candidatus Altiarchaeota archaeon]
MEVFKFQAVEFLIALGILIAAFSPLYISAKKYHEIAEAALLRFNESIKYQSANSLIQNLQSYGEPFEVKEFGKFDLSKLDGVRFDLISNTYTYDTYSRW